MLRDIPYHQPSEYIFIRVLKSGVVSGQGKSGHNFQSTYAVEMGQLKMHQGRRSEQTQVNE